MARNIKYCINCGHEMNADKKFCPNCGQENEVKTEYKTYENEGFGAMKTEVLPDDIDQPYDNIDRPYKESFLDKAKSSLSNVVDVLKNKKIFTKRNIIALVVVIIGGFLLNSLFFKEQTKVDVVQEFKAAIIAEDASKLKKMIKSPDDRLEINNTVVSMLTSYYKTNGSQLDSHMEGLLKSEVENSPYKFEKRKVLFKERDVIVLQPRYINVTPYNEDVKGDIKIEIKHGDEVIKTLDGYGEIGPLSTAKYIISATFKTDYIQSTDKVEMNLFETACNGVDALELFSKVKSVNVTSNKGDAILYINGKSTDKKIKDIGTGIILEEGTEIYGALEEKGKTVKSDVLTIDEYTTDYDLFFEEVIAQDTGHTDMSSSANIEEEVKIFIREYEQKYQDAVNQGYFPQISDYLDPDSDVYYEYRDNINLFYEKNIKRYLDSYYIDSITDIGNDKYKVVVIEDLLIDRDGKEEKRKDKITFTLENIDGYLYIEKVEEKIV